MKSHGRGPSKIKAFNKVPEYSLEELEFMRAMRERVRIKGVAGLTWQEVFAVAYYSLGYRKR